MKGISPLIAAVLLIAFTMAIAGIMATWASTFSRERLIGASEEAECIGTLDLSALSFNNGTISVKVRNVASAINLTSFQATLEYGDASKNKQYDMKEAYVNFTDPLGPGRTTFFIVSTGDQAKPNSIEVNADPCRKQPSTLFFR